MCKTILLNSYLFYLFSQKDEQSSNCAKGYFFVIINILYLNSDILTDD